MEDGFGRGVGKPVHAQVRAKVYRSIQPMRQQRLIALKMEQDGGLAALAAPDDAAAPGGREEAEDFGDFLGAPEEIRRIEDGSAMEERVLAGSHVPSQSAKRPAEKIHRRSPGVKPPGALVCRQGLRQARKAASSSHTHRGTATAPIATGRSEWGPWESVPPVTRMPSWRAIET